MTLRSTTLVAAVAAMSWCVAPAALSQEPPTEYPPATSADPSSTTEDLHGPTQSTQAEPASPGANAQAASIDDEKIDQFADAYIAVQTIQQKAAAELQSAPDTAAADQVKTSAESEMISAVERSGLQVDEFNQIIETMAADVDVRNRVVAKLQEKSGG